MKIKNKKKTNKKEIKKIKFLTIAYVQNFDQNFTLIALSILSSHEIIMIIIIVIMIKEEKITCRNFFHRKDYIIVVLN